MSVKEIFYGIVTFGIMFLVVFIIAFFNLKANAEGVLPISHAINTALAIGLISGVIVTFVTKKRKGQ